MISHTRYKLTLAEMCSGTLNLAT
nr:hypothetical protein [Escherichia coli]